MIGSRFRKCCFILLALMLFLPVVSAFAYNNTFNLSVVNEGELPVAGAQVYVWDKYNPYVNVTGNTDSSGNVQLVLGGLTPTADNLTNPSPNVGILVMPDNSGGSRYAFAVEEMLFYNLFNADATAPSESVIVHEGCLVHVKPQLNDGTAVVPGIANRMQIFLPGVPWQVKLLYANAGEISGTVPSFDVVWPYESHINVELLPDNNWGIHTAPYFYNWFNQGLQVGSEAEVDFVVNHDRQTKGALLVSIADTEIASSAVRLLHYGSDQTIKYQGNVPVYLPKGIYNFNFALVNNDGSFYTAYDFGTSGPPPAIWSAVDLNGTSATSPAQREYVVSGGLALTVSLQLGADPAAGDETALGQSRVEVLKKVLVNGFEQWVPAQSNPNSLMVDGLISPSGASINFFHRLGDGTYKLRVFDNSYKPGVIDGASVPAKCFSYITGPEFVIANASTQGTIAQNLVLPQAAAVVANIAVTNPAANGYLMDPTVAYLSEYKLWVNDSYTWDSVNKRIFIPFARVDKPVVIRADYDDDTTSSENAPVIKLWAPINASAGITIVQNLNLDLALFTSVTEALQVQADLGVMPFVGKARVWFSPVVPDTDIPGPKAFGSYDSGFDNNVFDSTIGGMPTFKAEIGSKYGIKVLEEGYPPALEGFVPYESIVQIPADHDNLNPFAHECLISEDRSFNAMVTVDGEPLGPTQQLWVKVQSIFDEEFYDPSYNMITRQGLVTSSQFRVAGIKPGRYEVTVNLENIDPEAWPRVFNAQTMPFIRREIFVSEDSVTGPTTPAIAINLSTSAIGYVAGQIVDDLGNGVPGLQIGIYRKGRTVEDAYHNFYSRGPLMFLCSTDQSGQLVTPSPTNPTYVPLEAGDYDLFVEGIAVTPTEFSYDLGFSDMQPKLSFSIFPNNQVTPVSAKVMRKFQLKGTITEATHPLAYTNFQILDEKGESIGWGYTDANGNYEITDGVVPGPVQFGIVVAEGPTRRFYLSKYQMIADQVNTFNIDLNPTSLVPIKMVTRDSAGAALPQAGGSLFLFSNPDLNFRAPHWYLTWIDSDDLGRMNLYVPPLTTEQQGFVYGFRGNDFWKQSTVKDQAGDDQYVYEVYSSTGLTMLTMNQAEAIPLTWLKPANVAINATNLAAGRENRYIGVLMSLDKFRAGPVAKDIYNTGTTGMPGMDGEQLERPLFATYFNGAFRFKNVKPGREYVFVAYEAFDAVYPEEAEWAWEFGWKAVFRHLSSPFLVSADLIRNEPFRGLGALTVQCSQDPAIITNADDIAIGFTEDPINTTGRLAWPLVTNVDETVGFPLQVPVNYALRLAYMPEAGSKYLGRTIESVLTPATGRTFDVALKELKSLYGTFTFSGMPMDGQIVLMRAGADFSDESIKPIRINISAGEYSAYLAADHYIGYAVPMMGSPKAIDVLMPSDLDLQMNIAVVPGVPVFGKVVGLDAEPIFDASVLVMRKPTARSSLVDGESFIPYPAMMGDNVVRCGPSGNFFFEVEDGVDYYLQAVVPMGFTPGSPLKLSVNGTASLPTEGVVITVGEGGMIIGSTNVPAYIEAIPAGQNALLEQFGTISSIRADAIMPDTNGRYSFKLRGLDSSMIYDIVVVPAEPGKAVKKLTAVSVPADPEVAPLNIDLFDGFRVVGQLVDADGNPLSAPGVSVNLAMTLPTETYTTVASSKFAVRQTTEVADPTTYSLQNSLEQGQWTMTDEYGQFVFENVPQFLVAFVKTDYGFNCENVDYGRARTENFVASFATSNVMEVNVVVPVAGKIVGRLIDENGQAISAAMIEVSAGENWAPGYMKTDGSFSVESLSPGANYMVSIDMVPGRVRVFRMGVLVEPGKTNDLGSILVAKAVPVIGDIASISYAITNAFETGVPESSGMSIIAIDGNRNVTDEELLKGSFMQYVVGMRDLFFDPFNPPTENMSFEVPTRSGKANIGMVFHREDMSGVRTMVTWGWKPGLTVPTYEQLGTSTYSIGATIDCPVAYGIIEGTLKHAVDTTAVFNQQDAVIALYPVEKIGDATDYTLKTVPFPTAYTSPVDGRWFIRNVPAGTYRIKVITSKYGTQFFSRVVTIGTTPLVEELALGTSVKKISGKVVLKDSTTPVVAAKVNMFQRQLATSTDASGAFAFYLPVGEFVIPSLEIQKSGFEPRKVLEFTGIATSGVILAADLDLGTIELSDAVGVFEAIVKSADGNIPLIGAEVAMVFKESPTATVWTIGEIQVSDETGRVQFNTVPVGRDITFRARAHYHAPYIYQLTAAANTGDVSDVITLQKANPKVFYTGFVSANETDATKLNLNALFDFNQVVTQSRLGLNIAGEDRIADAQALDAIGGRLTSMRFNNTVPNVDPLIASVSYDTANNGTYVEIGNFNLLGTAMFTKEYEVDPLGASGFTGRQTDASGNQLPVGIAVPPGYLDPTIDSFNLTIATPTVGGSTLEGTTTPPQFAGPVFEFSFTGSNFAAGTEHQGLFEITIKYEEGTALEPRWFDTVNNRWSKVGILDGSVQYDYPQPGYVTFKVSHLTQFAVLKNVIGTSSGLRCDFNGDSIIDDCDIAALIARNQLAFAGVSADQITAANINTIAGDLLKSQTFTVTTAPNASIDDLNSSGTLDDSDLAFLIGWIQMKNAGLTSAEITESAVNTISSGLLGSLSGTLSKFPGETVSR